MDNPWPDAADPEPAIDWKILIDLRYLILVHLLGFVGWLVAALG